MSTLSGVSSKGEKGKSKFQSLDINSIYHKTNKGDTSEQQQAKSTVPRKHGMQNLGKVPSTRRAPVNLPSLKSEHSGSDPTVSLVPSGGTGWGSKSSDAAPPPITPATPATTSGPTQGTNAPAVVGTVPVPQTNITPTPPQPPKPVVSVGGDKTWSSVMVGGESGGGGPNTGGGSGPSFLAHQSPQFQAEFPSLPGEGGAPGPPPRAGEGGYGPGPSLRPQTEGSWAHGGGYQVPPPQQENPPRPLSTQFSPPPVSTSNMYKGVIPSFMLSRSGAGSGGFPGMFPSNFQNTIRPSKFPNTPDNRFMGGSRPPPLSEPEDLMARPIIREEDLNRMDEISRDSGWATQDDIDYNQKLAFSDEETNGNDEEKEMKGKLSNMNQIQMREEKKDNETEKENRDRMNIHEKFSEKSNQQPWQGRNSASITAADLRNPLPRLSSHSNATREMDFEDVWKEKRRQQSEQVAAVAEKAKQRKEEEEKRFEETRSKSENEKKKKDDVDIEIEDKKDPAETFRQMTQLDSRNFPRGDSQQTSYNRFQPTLAPRFRNQQLMRQQQQQQQNSDSRWNNQHFSGNKQRIRGDSDDSKEKDEDKEKRERNTPDPLDRRDKGREGETEWDVRRSGGSAWEGSRNMEDNKPPVRRDNKKTNDNYKSHVFDDRDSEWREKPDTRDRPGRPDSRDSRASRDSRTSREETRSLQESVSNDYAWPDTEYEKEIHEEKIGRKESYKDERRETQTHMRPLGRVPGPITREKMEAYEHKHSMQAEKKELMSTSVENRLEEDTWKKIDSSNTNVSWAESSEDRTCPLQEPKQSSPALSQTTVSQMSQLSSTQQSLQKLSQVSMKATEATTASSTGVDDINKDEKKEDGLADKKKDNALSGSLGVSSPTLSTLKEKERSSSGGRGARSNRGGSRQNNYSGNYNSLYFRGSSAWSSNKDSNRRGPSKPGKGWNASESEGSGDEVSASTESGKEDKKTERKQTPRSPKSGERKRDKDDRNRDSKKNEPSDKSGMNLSRKMVQQQSILSQTHQGQQGQSQQQQQQAGPNQQGASQSGGSQAGGQQSGYESGGRKEGFPPRGEPSRRGRGGFSSRVPGGRGPVGAHYGPPGSKPAFPPSLTTTNDLDANDSSSEEKKRGVISGRKDLRKSDSDSSRSKGKIGKIKRDPEDWDTTSEGSDSEAKGKQLRQNKKSGPRLGGDKRNIFNTGQMNGRPRSEDGKSDKTRPIKEDEDNSRFSNHSDIFHSNNGFQEVRSKKTGKDSRPLGKDELKRPRGKEKTKGLQGGNSKGPQGKSYSREWNNKPPRMQRMAFLNQQQQNQQQDTAVSDMNKLNQNISMFPIRDVSCPAPAPPPTVNAWEKPITAALRTTSPPSTTLHHHIVPSVPNSQEKNVIELNDHGPSGTNSQTSSPSAEKALSKLGREAVEKSFLDGSTAPVQTIVFENTNLKTPSEIGLKPKYPLKGPRIEKGRDRKLDEELDDGTSHMGLGSFKPGGDMKPGENKSQEPIQMPMSFSKSEDNADMKLDFRFDSDLTHLTDDKSNIPQSIHQVLGQNSAADLGQKIASVKKVWETPGSMMEHQHHDEVVSTSSSFTPNFGSAVDTSLDHSSAHQVDDSTFTSDVYTSQNPTSNRANYFIITSPQMQGNATGYTSGGANIIKQDPANPTSNVCKVKPQPQQTVISSTIGTHSGPSLSSPPPPFTQPGHFNYPTQYSTIPAIPSPPAVLISSAAAAASAQQVPPNHQGELFHSYPIGGPTVLGSQQGRSGFSQYPYGLSQSLGSTSAFSQANLYHLPQPTAPPNPPDVFPSLGQYRIPPSAPYGQSQQLSNSPSTVLITSSSNSLMSASVKSSPQPPPLGAIGSKAAYQSSAHPSQVQLGFIQYDTAPMIPQSFLQNSQLVQRHGGNNVVPTIQPPTSFYSGSAGGQTAGLFQHGSSILAGGGSQPAALHSGTAFGMQGFGAQSATGPAQPTSSNQVGVQSYSSPMAHFRGQAPAGTYLKAGSNPGQHSSDPAKSPSTSQDVINAVFSSGGGQIPSPKSRGAANSGGSKQPQSSQQPSPTQAPSHHKFTSYQPQPNMVMQGGSGGGNQGQQAGAGGGNRGPPPMPQGVRTGASNGNGLGNNGVARYPTPIQRPQVVGYQSMQQQRHRVPQPPRSQHQQHMKISNTYYQPQGNTVKLDVEGKDGDKLQEATNPTNKAEKKEEQTNSSDQ